MKCLKFTCNECGKEFELSLSSFNPLSTFAFLNNLSSHAKTHGLEANFDKMIESFGIGLNFTVKYQ
mgnify:CR=1 FL=1